MLLAPETTSSLGRLRDEYERRADGYKALVDPVLQRGAYNHLMGLLARIRELEGYPRQYFCGLTPVRPPY